MAKDEHELEASEGSDSRAAETRRLILARRARFVAAALATAGIAAASCEDNADSGANMGGAANEAPPPEVCLGVPVGGMGTGMVGGGMSQPQSCLSGGGDPYPPVVDGGAADDDGGALPLPCLV